MSEVYQTPVVSLPCAAVAIHEGYLYKSTGSTYYRMTPTTAQGDTVIGIAAKTYMDVQLGTAGTMVAGEEQSFFLLGCGKIVNVAFVAAADVTPFMIVYASATGGYATHAHSTSRPIGHAMVKAEVASASAGQLLPVLLDIPIGTATVA